MEEIRTKARSTALLMSGALGNALPAWSGNIFLDSICEIPDQGFMLRMSRRPIDVAGLSKKAESRLHLIWIIRQALSRGYTLDELFVQPTPPDWRLVLNAEYVEDPIPRLHYSRMRAPMREALHLDGRDARGLQARLIVRGALSASSLADIDALVEQYPGHVIEFSAFEGSVGPIPGRNALIWECRNY